MRTLKTEDGIPLHWRQWACAAAPSAHGTVLLVHGLGEHIGRYEALAARLNAWGWHVVGHDHRGHGASGGLRGDTPQPLQLVADLAVVIDALRSDAQLGGGRLVLLGHSMGGLIAARFAMAAWAEAPPSWSRPLDGLVLSSPALDPGLSSVQRGLLALAQRVLPHLCVHNGLRSAWLSRRAEVVQAYDRDPLVHSRISATLARMIVEEGLKVQGAAAAWALPTLLLWAGADRCVAPAASAVFAAAAPTSLVQARCFEGLFHEIFNEPEREQVLAVLQDWLGRQAAPGRRTEA